MSEERWLLTNQNFQDLNPLVAGMEVCAPGKSFGPYVRNYTLIHYILSGKGVYQKGTNSYPVNPGQAFLILPGEVTTYTADKDDPWHYCWVGFDGNLSHRFHTLPPVFDFPEKTFLKMFPCEKTIDPTFYIASGLFLLYGTLFPNTQKGTHAEKVENLIRSDYMRPLRVENIAKELNLDRRYLTRIFKAQTGLSIQQYLIHIRLEAADRYLSQGMGVQECAKLCGYEDYSLFSRLYKKHRGHSPNTMKRR